MTAVHKVLLVDPGKVSESWYAFREMPSLALGCLGTYLSRRGYEVRIVDMATYKINSTGLKREILNFKPDLVGITAATFNILSAYEAARAAKEVDPNIFVVLGGPHATALPEYTLKECSALDAVVAGEGEDALEQLCKNPRRGVVRGVEIADLNQLPLVDWTLFDYSKFKKLYSILFATELHKYTVSIVRGCPFNCKFCFKLLNDPPRTRSAENVFAEITQNYERFGAKFLYFSDSTLLIYKENVHRLCRLIIESGLKLALIVQSRADTIDAKSVDLLQRAGCETFFVGVESGNEELLKRSGKQITKDQVRSAVKLIHSAGIPRIRCSFIIGLDGDTRESIRETTAFARELKEYGMNRASVHCLDLYPKTEYWNMVERGEGSLQVRTHLYDWSIYSRMYPMASCGDISIAELKELRDFAREPFEEEI